MKTRTPALLTLVAATLGLLLAAGVAAQEPPAIDWLEGPAQADVGDQATVAVEEGYVFTGADGTKTILRAMGNPPNGRERGLVMPKDEDAHWFIIFEYEPSGFVKDDDSDEIDAEELFDSISEATEAANEYRKDNGFGALHVRSWTEAPHYDPADHNLVWALEAEEDGGDRTVNYNVRLLGREGYTSVTLVTDPETFAADRAEVERVLSGFHYVEGKRYADFRAGDKLAGYGLAALVAGGAGAAAVKLGLFAKLGKLLAKMWKLIAVGLAGIGAAVKRWFSGLRNRPGLEPPGEA